MFSNSYWLLLTFFFNYLKRKKMHVVHLDFWNISERQRESTVNSNLLIVYRKKLLVVGVTFG